MLWSCYTGQNCPHVVSCGTKALRFDFVLQRRRERSSGWEPSGSRVGAQWVQGGSPVGPGWEPGGSRVGAWWVQGRSPVGPGWEPSGCRVGAQWVLTLGAQGQSPTGGPKRRGPNWWGLGNLIHSIVQSQKARCETTTQTRRGRFVCFVRAGLFPHRMRVQRSEHCVIPKPNGEPSPDPARVGR